MKSLDSFWQKRINRTSTAISFAAHVTKILPNPFNTGDFKNCKLWDRIQEDVKWKVACYFPVPGVSESITALPVALLMLQCSLILILHLVCQKSAICTATTIKDSLKQSSTLPSCSCNNKGIDGKKQVTD